YDLAQSIDIPVERIDLFGHFIGVDGICHVVHLGGQLQEYMFKVYQHTIMSVGRLDRTVIVLRCHALFEKVDNIGEYKGEESTDSCGIFNGPFTLEKDVPY